MKEDVMKKEDRIEGKRELGRQEDVRKKSLGQTGSKKLGRKKLVVIGLQEERCKEKRSQKCIMMSG